MIAKKHTDKLDEIKKNIEQSRQYFSDNINRYKAFSTLVYKTALSDHDIGILRELDKPTIEFNSLESYINRLIGEFLKHEPDIKATAEDGVPVALLNKEFFKTMELIESYIREQISGTQSESTKIRIYKDILSGGFSVGHVYTEYVNDMSFEQNIKFERAYDPILTGFDPLAALPHKGDGRYCFQLVPLTKKDFIKKYGEDAAKDIVCANTVGQFSWGYKNEREQEDIILVAAYYEKQYRQEKLVLLSNKDTMLKRHYDDYVKIIQENYFVEAPKIISERETSIEVIVRYDVCQSKVLERVVTPYRHLPLVFFDGNSCMIYNNNTSEQMTKPYVYHAAGMQRLKNFAGQTVANEIENMKMTQWIVSREAVPEDYVEDYINPQRSQSLFYNEFLDGNVDVRLTPPREASRTPTPPIVLDTFMNADAIIQSILGSYDAAQGYIGNKDLSGKAIQYGAMQSQQASAPYLSGFINGLERVANIFVDLIPKFYKTPRTIPVRLPTGQRDFVVVNNKEDDKSVMLQYDPKTINIKIEVGVNSQMQKQLALNTLVSLSSASPMFAEFINTDGLEILLENIDIRGQDQLKKMGKLFLDKKEKQAELERQVMMQKAQEPNVEEKIIRAQLMLEREKTEQRQREAELKAQVEREKIAAKLSADAAKVSVDEQNAFTKHIEAKAKIENMSIDTDIKQQKASAENAKSAIESVRDLSQSISKVFNAKESEPSIDASRDIIEDISNGGVQDVEIEVKTD